jgi:hypothetical protein
VTVTGIPVPCVDCVKEGLPLTRKATRPGPRCATHKRAFKNAASERRWAAYILKQYHYTPEMYWALYEAQGGHCALCQRATGKTKKLALDHDHSCCPGPVSCGRCVRGLLCGPCNRLLGFARDTLVFFQRCIDYLTNPPAQRARIWRNKNG